MMRASKRWRLNAATEGGFSLTVTQAGRVAPVSISTLSTM